MARRVKKGDAVEWNTSQGKTRGTVKKKLTSSTKIKGHKVEASRTNPEYLVESDKTGAKAAHKPAALKKVSGSKKTSRKAATSKTASKNGAARTGAKASSKKGTSASSAKPGSARSAKSRHRAR